MYQNLSRSTRSTNVIYILLCRYEETVTTVAMSLSCLLYKLYKLLEVLVFCILCSYWWYTLEIPNPFLKQ